MNVCEKVSEFGEERISEIVQEATLAERDRLVAVIRDVIYSEEGQTDGWTQCCNELLKRIAVIPVTNTL